MPAPRYLAVTGTGTGEVAAAQASAGAANANQIIALGADGLIDASMLTKAPGAAQASLTASEAIAAGAMCNAYNNSGTEAVQNADASVQTKPANCFAPAAIASGASGTVIFSKTVITGMSGLTPGPVFLSETTKGGTQAAGSATPGHTFQKVGEVLSGSTFVFTPETPILRN